MSNNRILYQEYKQNLLFNVSAIGWLGNIVSATTLLCSAVTLLHSRTVVAIILELMNLCNGPRKDEMHHFIENFLLCTATVSYVLSLCNILVSTMLLIGTSRRSCSFIFPWLVYQGLLYGIAVHLSLYMALSNLFLDFTVFVFGVMIITMAMIIFLKIYTEVFMLFKLLKDDHHEYQHRRAVQRADAVEEVHEHNGSHGVSNV